MQMTFKINKNEFHLYDREENLVEKRESVGYKHFLHFLQLGQRPSFQG